MKYSADWVILTEAAGSGALGRIAFSPATDNSTERRDNTDLTSLASFRLPMLKVWAPFPSSTPPLSVISFHSLSEGRGAGLKLCERDGTVIGDNIKAV